MKCVICAGVVNEKEVEEKIVVGNDVFFITLTTEVCTSCGERYYTDAVMDKLSKLKKRLAKPQKKILPVGTVYRVPHPI
jgi:YgiT-type zinc finger domain-containing protein